MDPQFYFFYVYYQFFFDYEDKNMPGSKSAIICCYLSKKHKLALYQTQGGAPDYT